MKFKSASLVLILLTCAFALEAAAQTETGPIKTGVLQSRAKGDASGTDNYEYATFSFLAGGNGPEAQKLVRNDWDIQFTTNGPKDGLKAGYFHVTMVVDDRSRIVDLGALDWTDSIVLPYLPAFEKPTREKDVQAKIGHIYYVHTADSDSDHYALFRVEELKIGESAAISWKLIANSAETSK